MIRQYKKDENGATILHFTANQSIFTTNSLNHAFVLIWWREGREMDEGFGLLCRNLNMCSLHAYFTKQMISGERLQKRYLAEKEAGRDLEVKDRS